MLKSAKFPVEVHPERPSKYPKDEEDGLDFTGISFPTPLREIPKVEQLNRVRINVFWYNEETLKINILLVSDRENEDEPTVNVLPAHNNGMFHYCLVKSLSVLLFAQQQASQHHVHYCERCLRGFSAVHVLQKHKENCKSLSRRPTRVEMPENGKNTLQFENYKNQQMVPWMIVFDIKSLLKKWEVPKQDLKRSWTATTLEHEPCGFSIEAVRSDGKTMGPFLYRGEDCVEKFLEKLKEIEQAIPEDLENTEPMKMEREDNINFKNAEECHICGEGLTRRNARDEAEVWDPATGEYCRKAHQYKKSPYNDEKTKYTCFWDEMECLKEGAEGKRAK